MAGELERKFRLLNGLRHGNLPNKARESRLGSLSYYLISLTHSLTRVMLFVLLSVIDSVVVVEFVAIGIQVDGAGDDIATAEVDVLAVGEVDIAAGVACGWRWGRTRWDEVDTRWGDVDTRIRVHPDPRVGLPTEVVRAQRPGSGGRSRALFHQAIFRVTRAETETSKCPNSLFPQLPVSPTPLCPRKGCRCFEGASLPRRARGGRIFEIPVSPRYRY